MMWRTWVDTDSPVVQRSTGVLAALDFDHQQREKKEEHGHAEANTVHSFVAHQHVTVYVTLHARNGRAHPPFTETRDLQQHKNTWWDSEGRRSALKKNQSCASLALVLVTSSHS